MLQFTHGNSKAQKYLLGGFELLVGDVYKNDLLPKSLHILKLFYDNDILEEETLIEWGDKGPSKKYVKKDVSKQIHEKVATFINWLKEADEESSDEEEEGVEVHTHMQFYSIVSVLEGAGGTQLAVCNHQTDWALDLCPTTFMMKDLVRALVLLYLSDI